MTAPTPTPLPKNYAAYLSSNPLPIPPPTLEKPDPPVELWLEEANGRRTSVTTDAAYQELHGLVLLVLRQMAYGSALREAHNILARIAEDLEVIAARGTDARITFTQLCKYIIQTPPCFIFKTLEDVDRTISWGQVDKASNTNAIFVSLDLVAAIRDNPLVAHAANKQELWHRLFFVVTIFHEMMLASTKRFFKSMTTPFMGQLDSDGNGNGEARTTFEWCFFGFHTRMIVNKEKNERQQRLWNMKQAVAKFSDTTFGQIDPTTAQNIVASLANERIWSPHSKLLEKHVFNQNTEVMHRGSPSTFNEATRRLSEDYIVVGIPCNRGLPASQRTVPASEGLGIPMPDAYKEATAATQIVG
ncbi:hypothetical protein MIND_00151700 [Mycena indigotica]|uniref:Uncharacterized protein n=1 Tax=Mycena indigotica TaxID=2126181 RepID=A0A8H6WL14_9AGAR|nr:uncharacterized protein MIND_00151700 [Mycena indigotica]KAF7316329.1 hypothetical protein MIND_00151700 [Mycena indigotica]